MAINAGQQLLNATVIGASSGTLYTSPGTVDRVKLTKALVTNSTAGGVTLDIWVLNSGDSEGDSFKIYDAVTTTIAADSTTELTLLSGIVIPTGGTLRAGAGSGSALYLRLYGITFTT